MKPVVNTPSISQLGTSCPGTLTVCQCTSRTKSAAVLDRSWHSAPPPPPAPHPTPPLNRQNLVNATSGSASEKGCGQASQGPAGGHKHCHGCFRFSKPSPPSQHQKSSSDTAMPLPVSALSRAFSSPAPLLAHQKSRSSVRSVSHRLSEQLSLTEVCHPFACLCKGCHVSA